MSNYTEESLDATWREMKERGNDCIASLEHKYQTFISEAELCLQELRDVARMELAEIERKQRARGEFGLGEH